MILAAKQSESEPLKLLDTITRLKDKTPEEDDVPPRTFPCVWLNGDDVSPSPIPIMEEESSENPEAEVSPEIIPPKVYKCDDCAYATRHQSNLAVHRRTHTGERPYWCGACGMRYTQGHLLKSHIRSRHGAQMIYYNLDKRTDVLKISRRTPPIPPPISLLPPPTFFPNPSIVEPKFFGGLGSLLTPSFLSADQYPGNKGVDLTSSHSDGDCEHARRLKFLRKNVVRMLSVLTPDLNLERTLKHDTDQVDRLLEDVLSSSRF